MAYVAYIFALQVEARLMELIFIGYMGIYTRSPGPLQLVNMAQSFHRPDRLSWPANHAHVDEYDGRRPASNWTRPAS